MNKNPEQLSKIQTKIYSEILVEFILVFCTSLNITAFNGGSANPINELTLIKAFEQFY